MGVQSAWPCALRRGWRSRGRRNWSLNVVASDNSIDDVTNFDGATWSRVGLSLRYQELVAMELTVGVAVAASLRSNSARLLYDSCVLSCQLRLMPLIATRSNYDDHLFTGGLLFGLRHRHRFERVVSESVSV